MDKWPKHPLAQYLKEIRRLQVAQSDAIEKAIRRAIEDAAKNEAGGQSGN